MKLKTVIHAKDALQRLTEKRFTDYKKVRAIVKLRQAVDAEFEFYAAEEKKAAESKPGIEPINYEEDKAAAEAEKKAEEEDDPFADIFKIFNRER